jgi:hypothetical protein
MEHEPALQELEFGGRNKPLMRNGHPIKRPLEMILPIGEEGFKAGKARRDIVFLPDEGLQKPRMVGHTVKDFRCRKTVAPKLA